MNITSFDDRRDIIILPTTQDAIEFAATHWIHTAVRSIQQKGRFGVALSGGSTPAAIYQLLAKKLKNDSQGISWDQVYLFWSDERASPPDDPESNYKMSMDHGIKDLPVPKGQIFRMEAENRIEEHAKNYEEKIKHFLGKSFFDLVMLGVGTDGHTASLFPETEALQVKDKLVCANFIPQKKTWRMTLTYPCIEQSSHAVIYALGASKKEIVLKVLDAPIISPYPASSIGTPQHKALWVLDQEAASLLT